MKQVGLSTFIIIAGLAIGCASGVKKADIASTADPSEEIQRLESEIAEGYANQLDVLAPKDLAKSEKALKAAKKGFAKGNDQQDILESVAISEGYLQKANSTAEGRRATLDGVVNARAEALKSGAHSDSKVSAKLKSIDDDLRSEVNDVGDLTPDELSEYQRRYMGLELDAVKASALGRSVAAIEGSKSKAKRYAPNTLRQAQLDIKNAENTIAAERRNPESFAPAVAKANASTKLLMEALEQNKQSGWKLDENTSIKLVEQNRAIAGLQGELGTVEAQSERLNETVAQQRARLGSAAAAIHMQKALDTAREEFSDDEADVFQQGDKLLIRLKSINFPSGRADLPQKALPVLAKVREVAEELNPEAVVVEGHTDSVGSSAINTKLSQQRADAVATYFGNNGLEKEIVQAVGLGFQKPIASNKTASGRSINRRVDVIITPSASSAEPQATQQ